MRKFLTSTLILMLSSVNATEIEMENVTSAEEDALPVRNVKPKEDLKNEVDSLVQTINKFVKYNINNVKLSNMSKYYLKEILNNINEFNNTYTNFSNIYSIGNNIAVIGEGIKYLLEEDNAYLDKNALTQIYNKLSQVCNKYTNVILFYELIDINQDNICNNTKIMSKDSLYKKLDLLKQNIKKNIINKNSISSEYNKQLLLYCLNNFYNGITDSNHYSVIMNGCQISVILKELRENNSLSEDQFKQISNQLSVVCNSYANLSVFYGMVDINQYKN